MVMMVIFSPALEPAGSMVGSAWITSLGGALVEAFATVTGTPVVVRMGEEFSVIWPRELVMTSGMARMGLWEKNRRGQGALLVNRELARHNDLAVLHLYVHASLVVVDHTDVFGHFFKLVGKSLTLDLCEDPSLVQAAEEDEEVVQQDGEAVIMVEEEEEEEEEGVILQEEEGSPAVIVEEVPSAQVEECYSAQVLVYDDGTYLMQDVAEEQEVVTEAAESVEMSGHDMVCFDKTFEAAEALLHMESPGGLHNDRSTVEDVMMETVVEVSTECGPIEEDSFPIPPDCEPAAKKKRGGGRKPKTQQPASNGSYDLGIKKRPREGKDQVNKTPSITSFCHSDSYRQILEDSLSLGSSEHTSSASLLYPITTMITIIIRYCWTSCVNGLQTVPKQECGRLRWL
ncbi:hypothetical protein CCH79_00016655 [Gambusia affinis]|uniref:Transcription factor Elf N-terminal domain-containing protein n=1 Tax=Gambusia affinis TaxID=33528 RepID=A0A315W9P4_GAMAF|nr:hypothetical protein CCH79_00016655 [Gambusia affinis]